MVRLKPFEYLSSLQGMGIHMDLSVIDRILEKMNHPQHAYPSILVGGTNGKGSICAMASSMLVSAGFNVGLYTSPHLIDVRERIRINSEVISTAEMASCIDEVRSFADDALTYFEFLTVVAFLFFRKKKVDIAVLEVGLGGRLDATNVVRPLVSAISNISLEHSEYLGKRLSLIAGEKAGIINEGGICITSAVQASVVAVVKGICQDRKATMFRIGHDIKVSWGSGTKTFSYHGLDSRHAGLPCPLLGRHQIKNAAVAIGMMEILSRQGLMVSPQAIRMGLANTRWEGRLEVLQQNPQILLDGAHNPAGISVLCRALKADFVYRKLIVICGVLSDKDFKGMIKGISKMADIMILTRPASERALIPAGMAGTAERYAQHVLIEEDPMAAVKKALTLATPDDLICVTGSLYLVGQIKSAFGHRA